jgi:hypothetical protein
MFGSTVLDVVVGLIFVYLLASLMVTAATELLAGWLGWRADKLWDGIRNLINSPEAEDWARKLYDHPLIRGLSPLPTKIFAIGKLKLAPVPPGPSYIPAQTFSTALLDLIQHVEPAVAAATKGLQELLDTVPNSTASTSDVKRSVLLLLNTIPITSPPSPLGQRVITDLQALADKIPDSDLSIKQLIEGVQTTINKISDSDWTQVTLKKDLQNLINNPGLSADALVRLKNDLQAFISIIPDSPVTGLPIKTDLQAVINRIPDLGDPAAIATQILRAFTSNMWERYIADIVGQIPNANLRTTLTALLQESEHDFVKFKDAVETWFNDAMDRVSGWYKRHTQWIQLLLGIGFTFALNLDSILIVRVLSKDTSGLRESLVAAAQKFAENPTVPVNPAAGTQPSPSATPTESQQTTNSAEVRVNSEEHYRLLQAQFDQLNLPIGWTSAATTDGNVAEKPLSTGTENPDYRQWPGWTWQGQTSLQWLLRWRDTIGYHFVGWLLTTIAISLGAPFWFDLLNRFVSVRASGSPPPDEAKPSANSDSTQKG